MTYRETLLKAILLYQKRTGYKLSTASRKIFKDGKRAQGIIDGANVTMEVYERAILWLKRNTPRRARK